MTLKKNFERKYDGDLKCPFCRQVHEIFEHIFQCNSGIFCRRSLRGITMKYITRTKKIDKVLVKYQKCRGIFFFEKILLPLFTLQGFEL